jgi:hypothetical protein
MPLSWASSPTHDHTPAIARSEADFLSHIRSCRPIHVCPPRRRYDRSIGSDNGSLAPAMPAVILDLKRSGSHGSLFARCRTCAACGSASRHRPSPCVSPTITGRLPVSREPQCAEKSRDSTCLRGYCRLPDTFLLNPCFDGSVHPLALRARARPTPSSSHSALPHVCATSTPPCTTPTPSS